MKIIFGRFLDCLVLWLLTIWGEGSVETGNFWQVLSANCTRSSYCLVITDTVFNKKSHAVLWQQAEQNAWDYFFEQHFLEQNNDKT